MPAVARNLHSAGAAFARCIREMTPRILIVDHPGAVAALLALLSASATAARFGTHQSYQRLKNGEGSLGAREQPRRQRPVTMQVLAYFHTTEACGLQTGRQGSIPYAFSTSIVRAGLHRRRLRGTCVVSWASSERQYLE
jgi:hypothetical protein